MKYVILITFKNRPLFIDKIGGWWAVAGEGQCPEAAAAAGGGGAKITSEQLAEISR